MSNSVDEAVFDYFSLLLSEKEQEPSSKEDPKPLDNVVATPQPSDGRQLETDLVSPQGLQAKRQPSVDSQRKEKPLLAEPAGNTGLNKYALEQLLAPVAELDSQLKTQVNATATLADVKPKSKTATEVTAKQPGVTSKNTEKLETSANIKVEDKSVEQSVVDTALQTQVGTTPPDVTQDLVEQLDDEFQVLFFKVAGLTLAVPLVSLGGIVKLERVNHIMGRPAWYLGVQTHRDSQLNIVDSGAWVMPEKYDDKLAQSVDYQYIVLLEDSNWGLACESLVNSVKILKSEVNWRTKAGKRPWLAGVVKEQMCGILHVQALIELLNLGLGSQDSIG